ncbi:MAG: hypothetical protein FJY67_02880 [Calditrichaeota bacterium]|nr:hypothetical protein [Calditrichota bacterium]
MALTKAKLGPREELILSGVMAIGAVVAWYFLLYGPVASATKEKEVLLSSQEDSLAAVNRYKIQTAALNLKIEDLEAETKVWDSRFPPRTEIVELAQAIIQSARNNNLTLLDMKPSLFELYALEKAGAQMSGRHVMQVPLNVQFEGRYLDLGRMLDGVADLPFNMTIADVGILPIPNRYPMLDCKLRLFLYVHL